MPVCAIGPEVGFTRSDLDRSGLTRRRHVITKEEFPQPYFRSNLRLHSIQHVLLLIGSGISTPRFFMVVGGEGALDVPELHHPASHREPGGPLLA